jgi:2'-5' RNA ligase
MKESATYSLWLEPTGDIAYKLQERIKKLSNENGTPLFSPHVTLLGGIQGSESELVPLANTLASSVRPFELELTKAGYLDTFYQSLFIHVGENSTLLDLHKKACRLFDSGDEDNYMPHLSLLYGDLSKNEKLRILNMRGREFYINFTVKSIVLMKTDGKPDEWRKAHAAVFKHQ